MLGIAASFRQPTAAREGAAAAAFRRHPHGAAQRAAGRGAACACGGPRARGRVFACARRPRDGTFAQKPSMHIHAH